MTTDTLDRDIIDTSLPSAEDHLAVDREVIILGVRCIFASS